MAISENAFPGFLLSDRFKACKATTGVTTSHQTRGGALTALLVSRPFLTISPRFFAVPSFPAYLVASLPGAKLRFVGEKHSRTRTTVDCFSKLTTPNREPPRLPRSLETRDLDFPIVQAHDGKRHSGLSKFTSGETGQ